MKNLEHYSVALSIELLVAGAGWSFLRVVSLLLVLVGVVRVGRFESSNELFITVGALLSE